VKRDGKKIGKGKGFRFYFGVDFLGRSYSIVTSFIDHNDLVVQTSVVTIFDSRVKSGILWS
jgi:hypothetical protein